MNPVIRCYRVKKFAGNILGRILASGFLSCVHGDECDRANYELLQPRFRLTLHAMS